MGGMRGGWSVGKTRCTADKKLQNRQERAGKTGGEVGGGGGGEYESGNRGRFKQAFTEKLEEPAFTEGHRRTVQEKASGEGRPTNAT